MLRFAFWTSLGLILYAYVGYPVVIYLFARRSNLRTPCSGMDPAEWPFLTVLIPAHNEERWIERKIKNTLALDYPKSRMQIIVASDGSDDNTVEIAKRYAPQGVDVAEFGDREGKTATLNRTVARAYGEILVFTDSNALLERDALRWIVPHFSDPDVGGVAGNRACLEENNASSEGEGMYWRYEAWIKRSESRLHSCLGAYGQVLAVRRRLFPYVPAVSDDFSIPMKILVSTGARIVFEPRAVAHIPAAATLRQEWERKIRSHVALLYDVSHVKAGLNPTRSPIWWQFWSHHILRLFVPWAMLIALAVSPWLWWEGTVYQALILCEVSLYLAAAAGLLLARSVHRRNPFCVSFYFAFSNAAIIVSWIRLIWRKDPYVWKRTERSPTALPTPRGSGAMR